MNFKMRVQVLTHVGNPSSSCPLAFGGSRTRLLCVNRTSRDRDRLSLYLYTLPLNILVLRNIAVYYSIDSKEFNSRDGPTDR